MRQSLAAASFYFEYEATEKRNNLYRNGHTGAYPE